MGRTALKALGVMGIILGTLLSRPTSALAAPHVRYHLLVGRTATSLVVPLRHPSWIGTRRVKNGVVWTLSDWRPLRGVVARDLDHGPLDRVHIAAYGHRVRIGVIWRFPMVLHPHLTRYGFYLTVGDRPPAHIHRQAVTRGLVYQRISRWTPAGPMVINVLHVDLSRMTLAPRLARSGDDLFAVDTVSRIAARARALAAINGSFFSYRDGHPIGLLLMDGQIVSSPYYNRSVFGIRYDGTCFVDRARLLAAIQTQDGKVFLANGVNMHPESDRLMLYTSQYGSRTRTPLGGDRLEFPIERDGTVMAPTRGDTAIPEEGYVLSAEGAAIPKIARNLTVGSRVSIYTQLNGLWRGVRYAIGGGPTLVHDGKIQVDARSERIAANIARGRAPRTAIGYLGGKQAVLVTVDGRQQHSVGASLYELARILRHLGAREAINLDGGGSTTMVVHSRVVNGLPAGRERRVNNALVVLDAS